MERDNEALLKSLSRRLRPAMALSSQPVREPINETLAKFAVSRHRVGPLLHLACQSLPDIFADENAASILKSSYQQNIYTSLRQKAVERKLAMLLTANEVAFSFLKGRGLAEQLHDDPNARQSKDVDILVSPNRSRETIKLLNDAGYIYHAHSLKHNKLHKLSRQDLDMRLFKDLTFFDPDLSVPIELHRRLFKFEPKGLTADFNNSVKFSVNPSLSSSIYCLYLILHGALAFWPRLKWLVDLSIMARKMPTQSRRETMDIAKSYGCEGAVAASLLMAEDIFSGSLDDEWQALLEPFKNDPHLKILLGLYWETLMANVAGRASVPFKSYILSGSADLVFPGKIGAFESLYKRIMKSLTVRI